MIDIHCHILPGLDDGAETMNVALAMAEEAIADGITLVTATPHSSNEYFFDYARVCSTCAELQAKLGSRLTLATGCDFHLNPENLAAIQENAAPFCINQHDCLLVEFNEFSIPPSMDQTLHELQLAGLRPIITHPERNRILRAHPERLVQWVRRGCYLQVTAGSVTGIFGTTAQHDAEKWIACGLVHFVASDAHNTRGRPLRLGDAYKKVAEACGEEKARGLFFENPRAALDGTPLPHVPDVDEDALLPKRKRFFFF